jgi:hypothetical protein
MADQRQLSVDVLSVAKPYQRTVIAHQVNRMARRFDDDAFGSLLVGRRADSTMWVVDGLQRLSAAKKIGRAKVPCRIFESRGQQHEAAVFRLVNAERSKCSPLVIFHAAMAEGDEGAAAITACVESFDLKIAAADGRGGVWPCVKCIRSVEKCFARGGVEHLRDTLDVLCNCWGGDDDALRGDILDGMSLFLHKCDGADKNRLVKQLRTKRVADVLQFATGVRKLISSSTRPMAIAHGLLKFYNAGLREKKTLPAI